MSEEREVRLSWEWESKKDVWVKYNGDISKQLDAITKSKEDDEEDQQTTVDFSVENSNLQVDIKKMFQKNKTTGFQRKVRCAIKKQNGENVSWQWQEDNKSWQSYPPKTLLELESAYDESQSQTGTVSIKAGGRSYTVDLGKMEQKNDASGIGRSVRRVQTSAEHSSTATPAPPARITRSATGSAAGTANGLGKKRAKNQEEDEEEDIKPPAKKGKSSAKAKSTKSGVRGKSGPAPTAEPGTKRVVVRKGKAPVDPECSYKLGKAQVYFEGKDVYDVMLNQTNLQNNNNKFYVIQLLEDDNAKTFSVWQRWGRVGFKGQHNLVPCGPDLEEAKEVFCKKFSDKTKNEWGLRHKFKKVHGKYDLIKVDFLENGKEDTPASTSLADKESTPDSGGAEGDGEVKKEASPPVESKLDQRVQDLLQLICDIKAMSDTVTELEYDTEKLPLGKLTSAQIKAGYSALKKIEGCIEKKDFGTKLLDACNDYYTRIPHSFGMRRPPLIRDQEALKKETALVEALGDIEVAIRVLKQGEAEGEGEEKVHPVDRHYNSMHCSLTPLDSQSESYKIVEKYLSNTHAPTHSMYRMKIKNVFQCQKEGETHSPMENKMLLWHGSRLTNWYGILSQGLRIAPPEAPVTGYMFGKGLYFADISSKSANYCFATPQKNTGLVLLSEVSLGKARDMIAADYKADKLPEAFNSNKGLGMYAPDPKDHITSENGCVIPQGKPIHTGVENPKGYTLNYNEFVVYDRAQVKMKYLVEVEFKF